MIHMKKLSLILIAAILSIVSHAQKIYESYTHVNDSLRYGYGKQDVFPCGLPKDMRRQASTWDLVDKAELIGWMKTVSE